MHIQAPSWSITASLSRLQPPSSFSFIITAMRKAKGGGRQGDSIQDALLVSKGGESERECVCVMSGLPGQLMEWARARAIM